MANPKRMLIELSYTPELAMLARQFSQPSPPEPGVFLPRSLEGLVRTERPRVVRIPGENYRHGKFAGRSVADRETDSTYVIAVSVEAEFLQPLQERVTREGPLVGVFSDVGIRNPAILAPAARMDFGVDQLDSLLCVDGIATLQTPEGDVALAVVDGGIDGKTLTRQLNGWLPSGQSLKLDTCNSLILEGTDTAFQAQEGHGTMVAVAAGLAGARSRFLDMAILHEDLCPRLHNAVEAYRHLSDVWIRHVGDWSGMVINNSWGVDDISEDFPAGDPRNYSENPNHAFNRLVATLAAEGADIVFAAGNCGPVVPTHFRCQLSGQPPGRTIYGANSHPHVLTVGAVDSTGSWKSYSSIGPGYLACRKPDLCAYTDFEVSYTRCDGTSAACAVTSGCIAALRRRIPYVPERPETFPVALRSRLIAATVSTGGFNYRLGHGALNMCQVTADLGGSRPAQFSIDCGRRAPNTGEES